MSQDYYDGGRLIRVPTIAGLTDDEKNTMQELANESKCMATYVHRFGITSICVLDADHEGDHDEDPDDPESFMWSDTEEDYEPETQPWEPDTVWEARGEK